MITLELLHNSKGKLPPHKWREKYFIYSAGASPEPSNPPYSARTLHFVEIRQDRNSLLGKIKPQGGGVIHQYFLSSVGVPPNVERESGENAAPRDRESKREREREQRADTKNIALLLHCFLFVSTFYVRMWMFPQKGPKDNGGTHLLKIERLFPRRSTGLSGGTLPPETERAREREQGNREQR